VAGFANAVLRRLARALADGPRQDLGLAMAASLPAWLRDGLAGALGASAVPPFLGAVRIPPPIGICLRTGEERDVWVQKLRRAAPGAEIEIGALSPRCIRLWAAGDPRRLPGAERAWSVQEEGAQVVALCAGAQKGERVLDACAGRGGKTLLLAEQLAGEGAVDAADRSADKLRPRRASKPDGSSVRRQYAVDWTQGVGEVPGGYDRALVDAPCSGVGTLGRRPELAIRLASSDVARLAALQLDIVRRVATRVRPGGRLVYAVCSVLREETEAVVQRLTRPHDETLGPGVAPPPEGEAVRLVPAPFDTEIGRRLSEGGTAFRLLPQLHGTDGYFIASFLVERPFR